MHKQPPENRQGRGGFARREVPANMLGRGFRGYVEVGVAREQKNALVAFR